MLVPVDIDVGVATHTGQVRHANEDDFILLIPNDSKLLACSGRLFVIADGMGGISGGSEASRTAIRSLAKSLLGSDCQDPEQSMKAAFLQACRGVYLLSKANPRLRDMGTTLTAINMVGDEIVVGHVGDSRCIRHRSGRFQALTEDHAVQEPRSLLTRCIGAGQETEEIDVSRHSVEVGDVYVMMTDGVWNVVDENSLASCLRCKTAQAASDSIVRLANAKGGPDNATVLVLRILSDEVVSEWREIDLPNEERSPEIFLPETSRSLTPPRWPWLLIVIASLLGTLGVAQLFYGVDLIARIADMWVG